MNSDSRLLLQDILESIGRIEGYVEGLHPADLYLDVKCQDAVVRRLEIIGEAVQRLPEDLTAAHPEATWGWIAGARNLLTHEYFSCLPARGAEMWTRGDFVNTWDMITSHIPLLKAHVQKILASLE